MLMFSSSISHQSSIEIDSHGQLGTGRGVYSPYHRFGGLTMAQNTHDRMYLLMADLSEG